MDVPNVREPEVDEGAEASITEPDDFDVLFGRGKGNQYHFGNRRYQGKSTQLPPMRRRAPAKRQSDTTDGVI
jgi:hypothetical protein